MFKNMRPQKGEGESVKWQEVTWARVSGSGSRVYSLKFRLKVQGSSLRFGL